MPAPFFPNVACFAQATTMQAALALSVVKLFKSGFVPDASTTDTELDANEADYDDYTPQTLTAWGNPYNSVLGGAQITSPSAQFSISAEQVVSNSIGGYWIETAGGALRLIRQFDEPQAMSHAGDGFVIQATIVVPNGT